MMAMRRMPHLHIQVSIVFVVSRLKLKKKKFNGRVNHIEIPSHGGFGNQAKPINGDGTAVPHSPAS